MNASEISLAWIALEGIFSLGELGYETYKMGLKSEEAMEIDLQNYATAICRFPTLSIPVLGDSEFGSQLKKRAATIDCSQLPPLSYDEWIKDR